MDIKVGFVQFQPLRYNVQANIDKVCSLLRGVQADILILPELANSGYLYASSEEITPYCEPSDATGAFLSAMKYLAAQVNGLIICGFAELSVDGLYNSAAAIDELGILHIYRKTHLFMAEKDLFQAGDTGFDAFYYRDVCIGIMICFDWAFPEAARSLALRGAHLIAHPSDLVLPHGQQAMLTRSLENGVFSVTANRYGEETLGERSLNFSGGSQIVDPKGNYLSRAPLKGDCVEICSIDPTMADQKWLTSRNHIFTDRRPEMYYL